MHATLVKTFTNKSGGVICKRQLGLFPVLAPCWNWKWGQQWASSERGVLPSIEASHNK